MSTIAVVIPAHNAESFVGEAVESVLSQTRPPSEVIVVDDASTDGTRAILAQFGDRIRVIRNPVNLGQGASRNKAVESTSCDVIALLDADDKWKPQHLEILCGLLDRFPDASVAFSRLHNFGGKDDIWPPEHTLERWGQPIDLLIKLMQGQCFMPSGAVYRRSLHVRLGGFSDFRPSVSEDSDFFCRAALTEKMVGSITPTAMYRWHPAQSYGREWTIRVLKYFEYRDQLFSTMSGDPELAAKLPLAKEKTLLAWEQYLDEAWRKRRIGCLREMMAFGLSHEYLREATRPYAGKARVPSWLIRAADCVSARFKSAA